MIDKEGVTDPQDRDAPQVDSSPTIYVPIITCVPKHKTNAKIGLHQRRVKEQATFAAIINEQRKGDKQQGISLIQPPYDDTCTHREPN